ncbi:uncharacterized protein LOC119675373 [Teleopsis dalmanni]|uniref:uncharacterized protein LOC119675373 n=1 Tax=Teleopsis dalmanni TaxID=139649 RepID=UPI0018CEB172|nr:uncharacterized protein LOC119675373 [Teleopsis dalmanni]
MELSQLEETKIVIKSLLKCHQHEVTVGKLSQDFYKSEGYQIPFAKLGYSSLETFLRSLGNLVEVCGKGYSATLKLIQNENLALNSVSLASNASNRELTADIFTEIQDEKPTVNLRRKSEDDVDLPPNCMKDFKVEVVDADKVDNEASQADLITVASDTTTHRSHVTTEMVNEEAPDLDLAMTDLDLAERILLNKREKQKRRRQRQKAAKVTRSVEQLADRFSELCGVIAGE